MELFTHFSVVSKVFFILFYYNFSTLLTLFIIIILLQDIFEWGNLWGSLNHIEVDQAKVRHFPEKIERLMVETNCIESI